MVKTPARVDSLIAAFVAAVAFFGCSTDHQNGGSLIPNPVRTWGRPSDENSPRNPVPLGQVARVEGWDVMVLGLTRLALDGLLQSPPPPGYAYLVLEVEATRVAEEPQSPIFLAPGLLGASNIERGAASDPVCYGGESVNYPVAQGDRVRHGTCISVLAEDAAALVASLGLLEETWFAVR